MTSSVIRLHCKLYTHDRTRVVEDKMATNLQAPRRKIYYHVRIIANCCCEKDIKGIDGPLAFYVVHIVL